MFAAVLDTCVLWPSLQRDFLFSMAIENLYRPLWSNPILAELRFHERLKLIDHGIDDTEATEKAASLVTQMGEAFDDALVAGWEALVGTFGLPDPDDEHVVAAAVVGGAGVIVTDNLKHFPEDLMPADIQVKSAKEFATNTVDVDPERAAQALRQIATRHRNPRHSPLELVDLLMSRYGMEEVAAILRPQFEE